jgi:hypothetical protein
MALSYRSNTNFSLRARKLDLEPHFCKLLPREAGVTEGPHPLMIILYLRLSTAPNAPIIRMMSLRDSCYI